MPSTAENSISPSTGHLRIAGALVAHLITFGSLAIFAFPGASEALQWNRDATGLETLLGGLTGHLSHWSQDHLTWDLLVFFAFSLACLRLAPWRYLPCIALAAFLIPLEIRFFQPQFESYRGLSGIDSALFGLIIATLCLHGRPWSRWMALSAAIAFGLKTMSELIGDGPIFVSTAAGEFTPAVSAHVVGVLSGITVGLVPPLRSALSKSREAGYPLPPPCRKASR